MKKFGLSKHRYRELKNLCLQYDEMREQMDYELSGVNMDGMPHTSSCGSPTESKAIKNCEYGHLIRMIEDAATEADADLAPYILKSVTQELSYHDLSVPAGINQFYEVRRKFYYILSRKRQ